MQNAKSRKDYKWVGQEDPFGCSLAALAMIVDKTYTEVKAYMIEKTGCDYVARGKTHLEADDFLTEHGYALATKRMYAFQQPREPWPPEPFGEVHFCEVVVAEGSPCAHNVVMLADGTVLDPLTPESKRLTDYHKVYNVAAVAPINCPRIPPRQGAKRSGSETSCRDPKKTKRN